MSDLTERIAAYNNRTSSICIKCHKGLKSVESITAGMGPICRGKAMAYAGMDRGRGPKANYEIISDPESLVVLIRDLGPWDQYMTVTNAAETVVAELAGMLNGRRLHYIDSEGVTDELLVVGGKFAGFKAVESNPGSIVKKN